MCRACDLGEECENGPGSSCNAQRSNNPLLAAIRGGPRPLTALPGQLAAGCAIAPLRPAGATAIERPALATNALTQRAFAFDPKRYITVQKHAGFSSDYRHWPHYARPAGEADPNQPPANSPPAARPFPVVPVALAAVVAFLLYKVVA